eukprot:863556-Amphidinium_carterae.1
MAKDIAHPMAVDPLRIQHELGCVWITAAVSAAAISRQLAVGHVQVTTTALRAMRHGQLTTADLTLARQDGVPAVILKHFLPH